MSPDANLGYIDLQTGRFQRLVHKNKLKWRHSNL